MFYSFLSNKSLFDSLNEKFSKKLKTIEALEKKNNSKISVKMINKMLQEFNLMEKVSPRPLQYCSIRPKYSKGIAIGNSKRSGIAYNEAIVSLIKWLINGSLEDCKLYTIIERVIKISDQNEPGVQDLRSTSYKCLKDFLDIILSKIYMYSSKVVSDIINFMHICMQIVKNISQTNSLDNLINRDAFLLILFQILHPLDSLFKRINNIISKETKNLLDLSLSQKRMIYEAIVFCQNIIHFSVSDLDKVASDSDQLVPKMDESARYDYLVTLNEAFVYEILSIPRVGYYMLIMLKKKDYPTPEEEKEAKTFKDMLGQLDDLNFKTLLSSYHFSKMSRKTNNTCAEEEKTENQTEVKGTLLPELQKNQQKMFIFANVFTLLNKHFIKSQTDCISSALAVLDKTVIHLPSKLFNEDENFLDKNFNFFLLKNQLGYLVDSKTVKTLFTLILPNSFESVNPSSVMSL